MTTKTNSPRTFGLRVLLLVGITLLTLACTNDQTIITNPVTTAIKLIIGEWDWIKTVAPWTQQENTPETEGYTASIKFMENDSLEYYKNGILTNTYPYELRYRLNDPLNSNSDSTLVLVIDNGTESFFSTDNDTLIIDQTCVDGPTSYYERKNLKKRALINRPSYGTTPYPRNVRAHAPPHENLINFSRKHKKGNEEVKFEKTKNTENQE